MSNQRTQEESANVEGVAKGEIGFLTAGKLLPADVDPDGAVPPPCEDDVAVPPPDDDADGDERTPRLPEP